MCELPTGTVTLLFGLDVHRAAWIAAAAPGGQIVLSQSTRELADSATLVQLGEHRLCALDALAAVARAEGDDEAAHECLAEAEAVGRGAIVSHSYLASVLRNLGEIAAARDNVADARRRFEESLDLARGVGDPWKGGRALSSLAQL